MKPALLKNNLLIALLASAGTAFAGLPVSESNAVIGIALPQNKSTFMAVPFGVIVSSGTITSVSGTLLGVSTPLTPGGLTKHSIKITSRDNQAGTSAYGRVVGIATTPANTATNLTTDVAITPAVGDEYVILENPTLANIFGQLATIQLRSGATISLSDVVNVESGGSFTGYWHKAGVGWRLTSDTAGTGADQGGVVIPASKGVIVARKNLTPATVTIYVDGTLIPGRFQPTTTANNFTMVNNPHLLSTTLGTSGIGDFITKGASVSTSDTVYLESNGVITGYWFKTGTGWRLLSDTAGTGADQASVPLPAGKAILFRDRLTAGFAYPEPFAK
jgi:hypothetical protein